MTYRDTFEKCPRCAVELVDARSTRACPRCRGIWVDEQVLTEMVLAMLPPGPLSRLQLAVIQRSESPIGCPECGAMMEPTTIHEVVLDRCTKHGVWFDTHELEVALHRVADPMRTPPLIPPPFTPRPPHPPRPGTPTLIFRIDRPGHAPHEVELQREVIKVGRLSSCHLQLEGDDLVSRMHAVIEVVSPSEITIIDLGSTAGTIVNGAKVTQAKLAVGAHLVIGTHRLELLAARPASSPDEPWG